MVDPLKRLQDRRAVLMTMLETREREIIELKARIAEIDYWLPEPGSKAVVTARNPRKIAKEKNHGH